MDSMDLDIDMDVDVDFVPDEPIAPELIADETRVSSSLAPHCYLLLGGCDEHPYHSHSALPLTFSYPVERMIDPMEKLPRSPTC